MCHYETVVICSNGDLVHFSSPIEQIPISPKFGHNTLPPHLHNQEYLNNPAKTSRMGFLQIENRKGFRAATQKHCEDPMYCAPKPPFLGAFEPDKKNNFHT